MAVDLDLDDLRIRAASYGIDPSLFPPASIPLPLPTASTIAPAEGTPPVPQHRPSLPLPTGNVMPGLIGLNATTERQAKRELEIFKRDIEKASQEIERLNKEKEEALEREAAAAKSRDSWSVLSTVAQYISGVGAVILGVSLISVAAIPAYMMIASGVIGTGARILDDTHILKAAVEWYTKSYELQQKIMDRIRTGAFFLQLGLGLASGFMAWHSGALAAAQAASANDIVQKTSSIITSTSAVVSTGAQVGTKYHQKRMNDAQVDAKIIDTDILSQSQAITRRTKDTGRSAEDMGAQAEDLRRILRISQVGID